MCGGGKCPILLICFWFKLVLDVLEKCWWFLSIVLGEEQDVVVRGVLVVMRKEISL